MENAYQVLSTKKHRKKWSYDARSATILALHASGPMIVSSEISREGFQEGRCAEVTGLSRRIQNGRV